MSVSKVSDRPTTSNFQTTTDRDKEQLIAMAPVLGARLTVGELRAAIELFRSVPFDPRRVIEWSELVDAFVLCVRKARELSRALRTEIETPATFAAAASKAFMKASKKNKRAQAAAAREAQHGR